MAFEARGNTLTGRNICSVYDEVVPLQRDFMFQHRAISLYYHNHPGKFARIGKPCNISTFTSRSYLYMTNKNLTELSKHIISFLVIVNLIKYIYHLVILRRFS